jgi:hypothetical protein
MNRNELVKSLENCRTIKQQFAYELYLNATACKHDKMYPYKIGAKFFARLYPFAGELDYFTDITIRWITDPIVIETYIALKNGAAEEQFLPDKSEMIMILMEHIEDLDYSIRDFTGSKRSKKYQEYKTLRRVTIEANQLLADVMGFGIYFDQGGKKR